MADDADDEKQAEQLQVGASPRIDQQVAFQNALAVLNIQNFLQVLPEPMDGQNREQYRLMALQHVQPIIIGLPQAIESVKNFTNVAFADHPQFACIVPHLVGMLTAAGRAITEAIPGIIAAIALFKFKITSVEEFETMSSSFRGTLDSAREVIVNIVNIVAIIVHEGQRKRGAQQERFPVNSNVEELPSEPSKPSVLPSNSSDASTLPSDATMTEVTEKILQLIDKVDADKTLDNTVYCVLGGIAVVAILVCGGYALGAGYFGATAAVTAATTGATAGTTAAATAGTTAVATAGTTAAATAATTAAATSTAAFVRTAATTASSTSASLMARVLPALRMLQRVAEEGGMPVGTRRRNFGAEA